MDLREFKKQLRWSDYQRHRYWLVGVVAGILATTVLQNAYFSAVIGVSLIGAGVSAIRARRSAVGGIGISGPEDSAGVDWSTRDLESMSPDQQADHANITGGWLILIGAAWLALIAYLGWRQFREYSTASEYEAMAAAAGLVSRSASKGTGLAASSIAVCWSDAQSGALCSDAGLVVHPTSRSDSYVRDLVYTPRGLVLGSDRDVTWQASSTPDARFLHPSQRLYHRGAKALAALGTRVGWVSNTDVVVADLESERPLESPQVVAKVTSTERPLLALASDAVLYGPTENCALEWQDTEGCAAPPDLTPCAAGSNERELLILTKVGALWRATPRAEFTRVASGLRGCLLAVNDRFAFVGGEGPVARVDLGTGNHAIVFRDGPLSAITLSDHTLYFRTADMVKGIWIERPPPSR